eukprot:gene26203-14850_t
MAETVQNVVAWRSLKDSTLAAKAQGSKAVERGHCDQTMVESIMATKGSMAGLNKSGRVTQFHSATDQNEHATKILKMYKKKSKAKRSAASSSSSSSENDKAFNMLQGAMCRRRGSNFKRSFSLSGVNVNPDSRSKRKAAAPPASPRTRPL